MSGNEPKTLKTFSLWQTPDECLAPPLDPLSPRFPSFLKAWVLQFGSGYVCPAVVLLFLPVSVAPGWPLSRGGVGGAGGFEELSRWSLGSGKVCSFTLQSGLEGLQLPCGVMDNGQRQNSLFTHMHEGLNRESSMHVSTGAARWHVFQRAKLDQTKKAEDTCSGTETLAWRRFRQKWGGFYFPLRTRGFSLSPLLFVFSSHPPLILPPPLLISEKHSQTTDETICARACASARHARSGVHACVCVCVRVVQLRVSNYGACRSIRGDKVARWKKKVL